MTAIEKLERIRSDALAGRTDARIVAKLADALLSICRVVAYSESRQAEDIRHRIERGLEL